MDIREFDNPCLCFIYCLAVFQKDLANVANTRTKYKFNLASKKGAFSASIQMGRMNAKAINPLAAPLALMAVNSGTIDRMSMYVKADERTAKGNIDLYYYDLKLNLLKHDDQGEYPEKPRFYLLQPMQYCLTTTLKRMANFAKDLSI